MWYTMLIAANEAAMTLRWEGSDTRMETEQEIEEMGDVTDRATEQLPAVGEREAAPATRPLAPTPAERHRLRLWQSGDDPELPAGEARFHPDGAVTLNMPYIRLEPGSASLSGDTPCAAGDYTLGRVQMERLFTWWQGVRDEVALHRFLVERASGRVEIWWAADASDARDRAVADGDPKTVVGVHRAAAQRAFENDMHALLFHLDGHTASRLNAGESAVAIRDEWERHDRGE